MMYQPSEERYDKMQYKRCGKSGLKLPRVALGLWHNFGSIDSYENQKALIFKAFDLGITHFDIANNYGPIPGSAEENFGKMLKNELSGYRDELVISTKAGYTMWPGPYGDWGSKKYLVSSLDQSLKRLGLDYVDIFYHHRPDPETPLEETMDALTQIVRSGKALYVGLSNYPAEETKKASEILKANRTPCLIHQPKYNMFNRWVEDGLLDVLEEEGIGSIAFCPLAQGLLTDKYINGIPKDSRAANQSVFLQSKDVTQDVINKVVKLNEIASNRGQTLAQMALAWVLRNDRVTTVLIGASKVKQIEDNVEIVKKLEFTKEELDAIDEILK
ncbi:MAG: L-glyceraldehyde 3-phosphate reductase [Candidatus Galacturonibacter soehngenii]|uniref:L-glyceraldehyde 3-phosphate reductase n=2 Tax=Candidatus Galacturonatibacter soehngenii TaxID=2307010 RepID=A0A7V7QN30_9FIRM|nr:L-glyceraldehyde 3-phosphate reductase [Candidatus Galacturonibacter soehngenii]MBA4685790.1 L-glyceraldehyde 3-phosphate reductase [Candidatus Galacturonibacter soehngenii]